LWVREEMKIELHEEEKVGACGLELRYRLIRSVHTSVSLPHVSAWAFGTTATSGAASIAREVKHVAIIAVPSCGRCTPRILSSLDGVAGRVGGLAPPPPWGAENAAHPAASDK